jgi:hypothetical protein
MSPRQKKAVLGVLSAILVAIIGALAAPAASTAWQSKVSTSSFDAHVGEERAWRELHVEQDKSHRALDSARTKATNDLLVDVLCTVKDQRDRRCRQ